ncbi:MAG: hypothetical protein NVS3B25_07160 [Hymenobacter sp.]
MKNANARPWLRNATRDALYTLLFWGLLAASATGCYLTIRHLPQWLPRF